MSNKISVYVDDKISSLDSNGKCPNCGCDWRESSPIPIIDFSYYEKAFAYKCPFCDKKWNKVLISL